MSYGNRKHLAQGFSYFVGDHYRLRLFTYICAAKLCQTKQRHCYDKSINVSLYCFACLLALFTLARIACLLRFWVNKPFLLFYLRHAQIKSKALRGSLPKSVPLDFGLDKTFALYFYIINTTIHPNNEIAVRMRKLSILLPFLGFRCSTTVSG